MKSAVNWAKSLVAIDAKTRCNLRRGASVSSQFFDPNSRERSGGPSLLRSQKWEHLIVGYPVQPLHPATIQFRFETSFSAAVHSCSPLDAVFRVCCASARARRTRHSRRRATGAVAHVARGSLAGCLATPPSLSACVKSRQTPHTIRLCCLLLPFKLW